MYIHTLVSLPGKRNLHSLVLLHTKFIPNGSTFIQTTYSYLDERLDQ